MRILFLNQYFPPDPAPTGLLLREVAMALEAAGHEVAFASSGQDYRAGQKGGSRLKREMLGLWRLFKAARRVGPVDMIISATSPPLLVVVAAALALWRGARHCHWLFDMYPELATALGEVSPGLATTLFSIATRWAYRRSSSVIALDEDMASRLRSYGVSPAIIEPWVVEPILAARASQPLVPRSPARERTWLYSGNLGRAHEWKTLLDAQRLIEEAGQPWTLVFQGGGPSWAPAREYAAAIGLARCEWRGYAPEAELPASLLAADVLIVTQKPETCGLLWPSKLALARSLPRRLLWVGLTEQAIGKKMTKLPHAGVYAPGDAVGVCKWLVDKDLEVTYATEDPAATRSRLLGEWVSLVHEVR